jgi:hypothetical protein
MIHPDLLVLIVGVFVTFMAVWASVVYGLLIVQRRRRSVAAEGEMPPEKLADVVGV